MLVPNQMNGTPPIFRVLDEKIGIPWAMIAVHERQAQRNHYQSLEQLNRRGGLSWCEALAVLTDRSYSDIEPDKPKALALVLAMVDRWKATQEDRVDRAALALWRHFAPDATCIWELEPCRPQYQAAARDALAAALA